MDNKIWQQLLKHELADIVFDESLAKYSSFFIGGKADAFYRLKQKQMLKSVMNFAQANKIRTVILGGGTNVLFSDKGFRGMVIKIETDEIVKFGCDVTLDGGVTVAKLIKFAVENKLEGLEPWVGLPGTIGGAVRGNAGCNGLETKDVLVQATLLNPVNGLIHQVGLKYFNYAYREGKLKNSGEIVLDATVRLRVREMSEEAQRKQMKEMREFRVKNQPFGKSTGSFFKNPDSQMPAGLLLDKVGLKGFTFGRAQISEKHGNFFLNLGGASYADIIGLAKMARDRVKEQFGIVLVEEVQIYDEFGPVKLAEL